MWSSSSGPEEFALRLGPDPNIDLGGAAGLGAGQLSGATTRPPTLESTTQPNASAKSCLTRRVLCWFLPRSRPKHCFERPRRGSIGPGHLVLGTGDQVVRGGNGGGWAGVAAISNSRDGTNKDEKSR